MPRGSLQYVCHALAYPLPCTSRCACERRRLGRQRVAEASAASGKDLPVDAAGGVRDRGATRLRRAGTVVA
jgi:hypothetical protein